VTRTDSIAAVVELGKARAKHVAHGNGAGTQVLGQNWGRRSPHESATVQAFPPNPAPRKRPRTAQLIVVAAERAVPSSRQGSKDVAKVCRRPTPPLTLPISAAAPGALAPDPHPTVAGRSQRPCGRRSGRRKTGKTLAGTGRLRAPSALMSGAARCCAPMHLLTHSIGGRPPRRGGRGCGGRIPARDREDAQCRVGTQTPWRCQPHTVGIAGVCSA
jgi:hypothetical protein